MISFARSVKEEIVQNDLDSCCAKTLLSAVIKMNGSLSINIDGIMITIRSENAKTATKIHRILKQLYNPEIAIVTSRKVKLNKNNTYILKVSKAKEILEDLKINIIDLDKAPDPIINQCCQRAYLAGSFLACGSVNHPNTANYHLEIGVDYESHATFIESLMNQFHLYAKKTKRRNKYIIYLKSSEKIGDFLRIIGAFQALMFFESTRIDRDFTNNINRLENCLVANEMKTMQASNAQIEDINTIIIFGDLDLLDEKTRDIAYLRLENPEVSLKELVHLYEEKNHKTISKSGVNHQLKKIKEHANHLRNMQKGDQIDE